MRTRVLVAGAGLWLGVVVAGSGMTWLVIDHARQDVVAGQPVEHVPAGTVSAGSSTSVPRHSASPRPQSTTSPSPSPGGTTVPTPPAPTGVAPSGHSGATGTTKPGAPGSAGSGSGAQVVTRTWSGSEGRVTVSCTGESADLVSASPADGWSVEVGDRGPEHVEVEFSRGDDGGEKQVTAACVDGTPRFQVDQDD